MKKILLFSTITASLLLASNHDNHDNHEEQNKPTISFIGDFSYADRSEELHETEAPSFFHAHGHDEEGHSHTETHSNNGFNFNSAEVEAELPISEDFTIFSTFHLSEESFETEELYGKSTYKNGFNFKAGKFLSSFGLNNSKHSESWDFAQQPIINNFIFGDHGLNEKGIGLSWNNKNTKIGLEVLSGENERSFGTSEIEYGDEAIEIEGSTKPELYTAYFKSKQKIGANSINYGLSYAQGKTRWDHTDDDYPHALEADTKILGLDLTLKFPFTRTSDLTWTTEYIKRDISNGTVYAEDGTTSKHERSQSGIYSSLVYTINPQWRAGIQYDTILENKVNNTNVSLDFEKASLMAEHQLNENNRLRLQYNKDETKYHDDEQLSYDEIILQWTFAFSTGKHNHNH